MPFDAPWMTAKRAWPRLLFVGAMAWLACVCGVEAQSPELAAKAQQGKQAMAEGKFDLAAKIYAELVEVIPNNPGLLLNLGMARHMAGHDRDAVAPLQAVLKIDPNIFPANLFLGASLLRSGDPAQAIVPLKKAAEINPDYPDVRAMLGDALVALERPAEAVEHYRKLAELRPKAPGGWVGLGQAYEKLAQDAFSGLEKAAPESAYTLAVLANVRVSQQQMSSAFYLYKQAIEKDPGMRGVHQALAEIYRRTEHPDWAAVEVGKEAALPPLHCAAAKDAEKIECAWGQQSFEEVLRLAKAAAAPESFYWQVRAYNQLALQSFGKLAELPESPQRHELMSTIYQRNGRYSDAVEELRAALKLAPGQPDLERELATALYMSRDYTAAAELSAKLLSRQPNDAQLNWLRGDSLLFLQKAEEAIPPLKKAVEADPKLLAAHHALGRAYMQLGQDAAAVPHLKAALPLDEDGSLHYQLGQAYRSTGQMELAKQTLTAYQKMQREVKQEQREAQEEIQITAP
jgi:predicted Zn-dependent protease